MLTRRLAGTVVAACAAVLLLAAPAYADCDAECPPARPNCHVECDEEGTNPPPPGGGGTGGGRNTDPCTYELASPQPPTRPPGETVGAWYMKVCPATGGDSSATLVWLSTPPAGLSPAELARRALARIRLTGAEIGIAPRPDGAGLVGLPVWLWTQVTPNTWGPISASASDGGLTVTIIARAARIVWRMGDGSRIVCANPGTPYHERFGNRPSPTCGHTYTQPSRTRPGGTYPVTATTVWQVDWAGGGQSGVIMTSRTARTTVRIDELQVVTR